MKLNEAIHQHGALPIFEAAAEGECGDLTPLRRLGLAVETIRDAEMISTAAYQRLTSEEKTQCHWEASQDLHKRLPHAANT
jgi:hypothetical protein